MYNPSFLSLTVYAFALFVSFKFVRANTPISDTVVQDDLENYNGITLALASRPVWHFGKSMRRNPCYPGFAVLGGVQQGAEPNNWPDASSGCPDPGPTGNPNPFPTYYTWSQCAEDEIRIVYNLYFAKDGWRNVIIAKGHRHDWERIIVIWKKSGDSWYRRQLLRSYHSGYMSESWDSIQNTVFISDLSEQGGKDKDHPKLYVGWGKHAMFTTRNTGFNDPASQGCKREYRSNDWRYFPTNETLFFAGNGSPMGEEIAQFDWGKATSAPHIVENRTCSAVAGGYTSC